MRARTGWARWARRGLVAATAAMVVGFGVPAGRADAAGVTTHAWMAVRAIDRVTDPELKALLVKQKAYVRAGAHFPDSGYALSNTYGEEAHWQRFVDALTARIQGRTDCPDLTLPNGPCAPLVGFLMGIAAHGMGDEVWDWLFEPYVADLEEYYTPESLGGYATEGGAETQMDLVAVARHGQPLTELVPWPDRPDLLAAFNDAGFTDIDDSDLSLGQVAEDVVHKAEASWAPDHIAPLEAAMPWTSHNMVTAPGGVEWASVAIAGYYEAQWGRLLDEQPQTRVAITYPAPDQRRIPATGWVRSHQPGSARGRGGARTRIAAALTYGRPYDGAEGGIVVSNQLPAGAMTLMERDTETPVAEASGFPKSVPYGADAGEHTIDIQPAADLKPCTWYQVDVTSSLLDARGEPVAPYSWDFRTGKDADGNRCDDDPYTADENFARKATADVLDRSATEVELQKLGYDLGRGQTRKGWAKGVLSSQEEREKLVTEAYQHYLDRNPDPGGKAYWATKLSGITLPDFSARLAGSDEVFRKAGATNLQYVKALYQLILDRPADDAGASYWANRIAAGTTRQRVALSLLRSREAASHTVDDAYHALLGRDADAGGKTYWTNKVVGGVDPRDLWLALITSSEYDRRAQEAP